MSFGSREGGAGYEGGGALVRVREGTREGDLGPREREGGGRREADGRGMQLALLSHISTWMRHSTSRQV